MPCWVSPPRPSSQRSLLAGTPASRRSKPPRPTRRCWPHTPRALSASKTALQSALDAILAELAALQLSGSGVVNAPAWAGFTTWELLRGSNVVRNLRFMAPLSAALANGDDTLSITADCYSTAGAAALLAYYTSSQVDTLLGDYRRGSAGRGDNQRHHGRAAGLLHLGAGRRAVGRLPHGKRAGHADAGRRRAAGLPDGPGPGRLHNQPNHLGAGGVPFSRRPGHGNGLEHRSRAAQLLHHRTSGLLAGKLGVTEAASALQIAVRFPDDGGADKVVGKLGETTTADHGGRGRRRPGSHGGGWCRRAARPGGLRAALARGRAADPGGPALLLPPGPAASQQGLRLQPAPHPLRQGLLPRQVLRVPRRRLLTAPSMTRSWALRSWTRRRATSRR